MDRSPQLLRLFGYEFHGGRHSPLWDHPLEFWGSLVGQNIMLAGTALKKWEDSKRPFEPEEITQGQWVKIGDHGHHFLVRLHKDGTLTESALFHPKDLWLEKWRQKNREPNRVGAGHSWPGTWRLTEEGFLRLSVGPHQLDVVASRDDAIHSGIEYKTGSPSPHAYFKVIHAR